MSDKSNEAPRYRSAIAALVIACAGLAAYSNTFSVPFLFDGRHLIDEAQQLRSLWPLSVTLSGNAETRPVGYFTFALNFAWNGEEMWGFHAVNLAIHCGAAMLLFAIVQATIHRCEPLTRYRDAAWWLSLSVALLWHVHPLQTQSVTYVYQRFECLAGLLTFGMLYCFIRGVDSSRKGLWFAGSLLCCALGMGTKEIMVVAPILVVWYDRVFIASSWAEMAKQRLLYYAGLLANWGLLAYIMLRYEGYASDGVIVAGTATPLEYALSQAGVITYYLRLCFWPVGQCFDYWWPIATTPAEIVPPLIFILGLVAATLSLMWKKPILGFVCGWFFVCLGPTSSIAPIADVAVEHRMYLPLATLCLLFVFGGYEVISFLGRRGSLTTSNGMKLGVIAAGAIVILLAACSWNRNLVYGDRVRLWEDTFSKAPHNYRALWNLTGALFEANRGQEALKLCRKAVEQNPDSAEAWNVLGKALLTEGDSEQATVQLNRAVELNPKFDEAYNNLAVALTNQGKLAAAEENYRKAIEVNPSLCKSHYGLARLLAQKQDFTKAEESYRTAFVLDPHATDAQHDLAVLLDMKGEHLEAAEHFEEFLARNPGRGDARMNYALALESGGKIEEAVDQGLQAVQSARREDTDTYVTFAMLLSRHDALAEAYDVLTTAAELTPERADIHANLASLCLQLRKPAAALPAAQRACQLTSFQNIQMVLLLSRCQAGVGQPAKALAMAKKAHQLAISANDRETAAQIAQSIKAYESNANH